jgi:hypothetical protein
MAHPLTRISNFNYNTLASNLEVAPKTHVDELIFYKAYNDDFWQDGVESLLPPAIGAQASIITTAIAKRFVFRNVIKECVERVSGAFFGKAPNWKFNINGQDVFNEDKKPAPNTDPNADPATNKEALAALEEIDQALGDFWTKQNVAEVLAKAFESRLVFGRGGIRIFVPVKYKRQNSVKSAPTATDPTLGEDGNTGPDLEQDYVKFPTIVDAIDAIRVEAVAPTDSKLLDDGGEFFSIVRYTVREDWEVQDNLKVIEFSFVDNQDRTFIGTVTETAKAEAGKLLELKTLSDPLDLDGYPTFNEFKGTPYITKALYKNNQLVNLALTCSGFALVDNGFQEMILTNVELETETRVQPDGSSLEVPKAIKRGGGAVQSFIGIEQVDDTTGAVSRLTPGVTIREPVPLTSFKDGKEMGYTACLEEAGQLYALISGDATASGESRIQALADFIVKIAKYLPEVDQKGTWLMTTVLLLAAELAQVRESFNDVNVIFSARMHVANLSNEEKTTVMTMRDKGIISLQTARVLLGIDDPGLEQDLVQEEQTTPVEETTITDLNARADLALKISGLSGIPPQLLMKILGVPDNEVEGLLKQSADYVASFIPDPTAPPTTGDPNNPAPGDGTGQGAAAGG